MAILSISTAALSNPTLAQGFLAVTAVSWALYLLTSYALNCVRVKSLIRNLPTLGRGHWFSGNLLDLYHIGNIGFHSEAKKRYGGALVVHGILGDEQIYFSDPLAMHHILIKELNTFGKPNSTNATNIVVLGEGLLTSKGTQHKKQRKILNPVFHIKHMRGLIPIFCRVTSRVTHVLNHRLTTGPPIQEINMFDWLSRLALELVGQAGIGYSFDSLAEGEKCEYTAVVKDLMPTLATLQIPLLTLPLIVEHFPGPVNTWLAKRLPTKPMRTLKTIVEVIHETSRVALEQKKREIAASEGSVLEEKGHDLLAILLRANAKQSEADRLSDDEVMGQMNTIIFAAQDTTSSALSRTLHTLSIHQAAQARLRTEICNARIAKVDGEPWSYDELNDLPYLDAVCRETLRVFAPVWRIARTASQATTIPLLHPITGTDGELITRVPIAKGQSVVVAIAAANRDEGVWGADAHEWNPDRWLNHAKHGDWRDIFEAKEDWDIDGTGQGVKERRYPGVYSGMMSFSGGGRACIGFKFSLLEMKVVLAMLIEKFAFAIPPNRDIVWNATNIQTPSLRGMEQETPSMPLLVSLA